MHYFLSYTKFGRYKKPIYRFSIKNKTSKRNGKIKKNVGVYIPLKKNKKIEFNWNRFCFWLTKNISLKKKKPLKHIIELAHKNEKN